MSYRPQERAAEILDHAWRHVASVPYQVSVRWVFYRLLSDGIYTAKDDYRHLVMLLSKARKGFYRRWHPDTLVDATREPALRGFGYVDYEDWLREYVRELSPHYDRHRDQDYYVELWFEAHAMQQQFRFYSQHLPLRPFGGDYSIPRKWEAAKHLAWAAQEYGRPIKVLYFGDYDPKGMIIPQSAWGDINTWLRALWYNDDFDAIEVDFIRVGLNRGHDIRFGLIANPDRPGTFQWESLPDSAARELITAAVSEYIDPAKHARIAAKEEQDAARWGAQVEELLEGNTLQ